ncbi:MAG TPA: glycerol-3-phosphate 1-O-acyltransferase PlsY [Tissierellaceae bacterium]|nr:glycerol-3-phosphate 1-O-acyltransferase PlsY [Tissierellaceae bacterium]
MDLILTIIIGYLIGCFSSAYFVGRSTKGIDIRHHGSGNAGATNALRVMGIKLGAVTLLMDAFKGIFAVLVGRLIMGYNGGLICGFFGVIGHNWPIFLQFKGGKGVATSIGVLATLHFTSALAAAPLAIIIIIMTRYVSLGSMVYLLSLPISYALLTSDFRKEHFLLALLLALLSIYRHKSNIQRLLTGNENRIGR